MVLVSAPKIQSKNFPNGSYLLEAHIYTVHDLTSWGVLTQTQPDMLASRVGSGQAGEVQVR